VIVFYVINIIGEYTGVPILCWKRILFKGMYFKPLQALNGEAALLQ
jgi:hypothetical protein